MDLTAQRAKADVFRKMHDRLRILVLPNAWDAASARIFAEAGARAIATTSSGCARALGYSDGEDTPRDEMIAAIGRIARSVTLPVSADIEAGYAATASGVAETVRAAIEAGAIGINLEDSTRDNANPLHPLPAAVERVRAAREAASKAGVPIVINARTDVFLRRVGEEAARFDHAVSRANAYRDAGADCLFIPAALDRDLIARLVRALKGPMNVLAMPGVPPIAELEKLGVARVSVGGGPARVAMAATRRLAEDLLSRGSYGAMFE
jgi:2-methylisocitrate lyase-like PEP mutase family enzyme